MDLLRDFPAQPVVVQPDSHKMSPMAGRVSEAISGMKQAQIVPKEHLSRLEVENKCVILCYKLDHVESFDLLVAQVRNVPAPW